MTVNELKKYYSGLLIMQYLSKPKAKATIELLTGLSIVDQIPIPVQNAFNLESSIGVQLDLIGKYAGTSRLGSNFTGRIVLSDADFRTLIRIAILKNNAGSTLSNIQDLLAFYFPGTLLVFDYQNMSMSYLFDSAIGTRNLAEMFVKNGLLPKPMGVQLGSLIYSNNISSFFGMGSYEVSARNVSGFNDYSNYQSETPWLKYENAIATV